MATQVQKHRATGSGSDKKNFKIVKKVIWEFPLVRQNYMWLLIGVGAVILGYILMATGITQEPAVPDGKWNNPFAVVIAPVILVIGYCALIPYGILKMFKPAGEQANKE